MRLKSTLVALLIGLSLFGAACSKSGGSATNMSEDDKHKLFQAAGITQDTDLIKEVITKLGLGDVTAPNENGQKFVKEHMDWAMKNAAWVQEYSDKNKAREYVKSHMP
jgi:hypothetical protein